MAVYEPTPFSLVDVSGISLPYLVMGGTQSAASQPIPALFDATVLATPRIHVTNPHAVHISYQTEICPRIDETRETAWLANPSQPEPLTDLVLLPSGLRACNPSLGTAAAAACLAWNMGEITSPTTTGFRRRPQFLREGRRQFRRLARHEPRRWVYGLSTVRSDRCLYVTGPDSGEVMVSTIKHYTVAFWKKFLGGDGHFMRYLTPGYAHVHRLPAVVDIRD